MLKNKKRYADLRGPIDWLEKSKLVSKNFIIPTRPQLPLKAFSKENIFKLFFFDLGLACHLLELSYQNIIQSSYDFKGFLAENFVQNEQIAKGYDPTYAWKQGASEIEFLFVSKKSGIIPVEVKSGKRTKAKSLSVFLKKYAPLKNVKLSSNLKKNNKTDIRWPLYYACYLDQI